MANKIIPFLKSPWNGGINTSVDPGAISDNDLVTADNLVFTTSNSRKKRQGLSYFDADIPNVIKRSSTTTTRTLVFDAPLQTISPNEQLLVLGELIKITSSGSGNDLKYASSDNDTFILSISTTTLTNDTITYTFTGADSLSESITTTGTLIVTRNSPYIDLFDYWRYDSSFIKQQLLMAFSTQGKLFKHDTSGRRTEVLPAPEQFTVTTIGSAGITSGDYWDFNSGSIGYRVWYNVAAGGGAPAAGGRTLVPVAVGAAVTAAVVATATQVAVDALPAVTATVLSNVMTVTIDAASNPTDAVDFNAGFTIAVTRQGRSASVPFSSVITKANSLTFNDRFILCMDGTNNYPIYFRPETDADYYFTLPNAPNCSFMQEHIGRLWSNDKANRDRLNYSSTGNQEEWLGNGDSGAIDVVPGDGDPDGINAIYKSLKGTLFTAKGVRLYRIDGDSPETFFINPVTKGLGCVAHKAAASVDLDDIVFVSKRGVHGLAATQSYGDFEQQSLSLKIHANFNDKFNRGRLDFIQSAYVNDLNSIAFSVSEGDDTQNNDIYLLNTITKEWYRWPNISCTALSTRLDTRSKVKLVTGTSNSRVIQAQNGEYTDFDTMGIQFHIKSGLIYPDGNPVTTKAFKYAGFLYRPTGHYQFTAQIKIDNNPVQSISFSEDVRGDLLGIDFMLGSSVLGTSNEFSSFRAPIDGLGKGMTIEITSSGSDEFVELYGFLIGFEPADDSQENE